MLSELSLGRPRFGLIPQRVKNECLPHFACFDSENQRAMANRDSAPIDRQPARYQGPGALWVTMPCPTASRGGADPAPLQSRDQGPKTPG